MEQLRTVKVFVSYRREDTKHLAGRLSDRLVDRFGSGHVFMDIDSVAPGSDFHEAINRAVADADVVLALIGRRWESAEDKHGRRRLADPADLVRTEIQAALVHGTRLIPVLVDGADMPDEDALPDPLRPLGHLQAVRLDYTTFRSDVAALFTALAGDAELPHPPAHPVPPAGSATLPAAAPVTVFGPATAPSNGSPDTRTTPGRPRRRHSGRDLAIRLGVLVALLVVVGVLSSPSATRRIAAPDPVAQSTVALTAGDPTVPAVPPHATTPPPTAPTGTGRAVVPPSGTTPPATRSPAPHPTPTHSPGTHQPVQPPPASPTTVSPTTPTPTTPTRVAVPDVTGMTYGDARQALDSAGFGDVAEQFTSAGSGMSGEVVSQSPSAGTTADRGTEIVLTVTGLRLTSVPRPLLPH